MKRCRCARSALCQLGYVSLLASWPKGVALIQMNLNLLRNSNWHHVTSARNLQVGRHSLRELSVNFAQRFRNVENGRPEARMIRTKDMRLPFFCWVVACFIIVLLAALSVHLLFLQPCRPVNRRRNGCDLHLTASFIRPLSLPPSLSLGQP